MSSYIQEQTLLTMAESARIDKLLGEDERRRERVRERWEAKQRTRDQEDERDTDKEAPQKKPETIEKSPLIAEPQTNKQEERREELMRATKSDAGREQESTGRKRLIPEEEEGDDGAGKEPTTKRARYGEDAAATKERNGQPVEIKFVSNGGASCPTLQKSPFNPSRGSSAFLVAC